MSLNHDVPGDPIDLTKAAGLVRRDTRTLYRWIDRGLLRAWKLGGRVVVDRAELLAMFRPVVPAREQARQRRQERADETARRKRANEELRRRGLPTGE